jgi:hypothetical protein
MSLSRCPGRYSNRVQVTRFIALSPLCLAPEALRSCSQVLSSKYSNCAKLVGGNNQAWRVQRNRVYSILRRVNRRYLKTPFTCTHRKEGHKGKFYKSKIHVTYSLYAGEVNRGWLKLLRGPATSHYFTWL